MGGSNHPILWAPSREATDWPKRYEFRSQPLTGHGYDKPTYLASSDTLLLLGRKTTTTSLYPVFIFKEFLFFLGL
jgi:hypothetical protein